MDRFLTLPKEDRSSIFTEAAARHDVRATIIEKDFWVCWTLKQLFESTDLGQHLTFKGGTSLSKAYQLIDRFSEDIDLTISRTAPYLADCASPAEADLTGKERGRRIDALKNAAQRFVQDMALPTLLAMFKQRLPQDEEWNIALDADDADQQTLLFTYPRHLNYGLGYGMGGYGVGRFGEGEFGYIKPTVKLEFGARGDIDPHQSKTIIPYAAEAFPQLFDRPTSQIQTLSAERTFWEKATILHALYHGTRMRDRMSRHYYDTYMLAQKGVAESALHDMGLLTRVVANKSLMFSDKKAAYELAVPGSLRLIPQAEMLPEVKRDYEAMREMFMAAPPAFDAIMQVLNELEERINSQGQS